MKPVNEQPLQLVQVLQVYAHRLEREDLLDGNVGLRIGLGQSTADNYTINRHSQLY